MKAHVDVDGGHAWLILFAISTFYFLSGGFRKSLSILLPTLKDQFETHTWLIGIMLALTHGVKDFLGKLNVQSLQESWKSALKSKILTREKIPLTFRG